MTDQLKKYMDKMEDLPPVIKETSDEIKELDEKVDSIMREIKQKTLAHTKNHRKLSRDQAVKAFKDIELQYKEAEKLSEKKIKIAQKMYDLVDEHIREMDTHVEQFNAYQLKKYTQEEKKLSGSDSPDGKRRQPGQKGTEKRRKGAEHRTARMAETGAIMEGFKPIQIQPNVDMPVNPCEPRYCVCHQVSFGSMVACDNKDCKYEWFHFQCVGLTETPPGSWYCEACRDKRKKK